MLVERTGYEQKSTMVNKSKSRLLVHRNSVRRRAMAQFDHKQSKSKTQECEFRV